MLRESFKIENDLLTVMFTLEKKEAETKEMPKLPYGEF